MTRLPKVEQIASMLPEELAPLVLQELVGGRQFVGKLSIGNFCGQFGLDQEKRATARALLEAWSLLEHQGMIAPDAIEGHYGWFFVTRRGIEAAKTAEAYSQAARIASFPESMLHAALRGATFDAFMRGNFQQAIRDAFVQLEVRVRKASGIDKSGIDLMREAFKGPLRPTDGDPGERDALSQLFAGAYGWFRNPVSHRVIQIDDVSHAAEHLMFASLLLRIVDEREGVAE